MELAFQLGGKNDSYLNNYTMWRMGQGVVINTEIKASITRAPAFGGPSLVQGPRKAPAKNCLTVRVSTIRTSSIYSLLDIQTAHFRKFVGYGFVQFCNAAFRMAILLSQRL